MATTATGAPEQRESREQDKAGKSQIVVVDLDEPQSPVAVKRLRKGKGKLFNHVERIVKDLVDDGTVKASAQPVGLWAFGPERPSNQRRARDMRGRAEPDGSENRLRSVAIVALSAV